MKRTLTILLVIIAVACIAGALYYPVQYQLQKKSNDSNMDGLRALRAAGMQTARDTERETPEQPAPGAADEASAAVTGESVSSPSEADPHQAGRTVAGGTAKPGAAVEPSGEAEPLARGADEPSGEEGRAVPAEEGADEPSSGGEAAPAVEDASGAAAASGEPAAGTPAPEDSVGTGAPDTESVPDQTTSDLSSGGEAAPAVEGASGTTATAAAPDAAAASGEPMTGAPDTEAVLDQTASDAAADGAPAGGPVPDTGTETSVPGAGEAADRPERDRAEAAPGGSRNGSQTPGEADDGVEDAPEARDAVEGTDADTVEEGPGRAEGAMPWLLRNLKDMHMESPEDTYEPEEGEEPLYEEEVLIDEYGNEYWLNDDAIPYYLKARRFLVPSQILPQYRDIYALNHDFVGWLTVPGTIIDYPVMQSTVNDYYLKRDFYGRANANGELILDNQCDPYTPSYNLVISGHNMRSGAKFGNMAEFASYDYWRKHKLLKFDTLMSEGSYVIVAAFRSALYETDAEGFRYMKIFEDAAEFDDWYAKVRANRLYDTGVDCAFGDRFITLSTCAYHTKDGRFVVVARKLRKGEHFENDPEEPAAAGPTASAKPVQG